jgi:hypothetical protein
MIGWLEYMVNASSFLIGRREFTELCEQGDPLRVRQRASGGPHTGQGGAGGGGDSCQQR